MKSIIPLSTAAAVLDGLPLRRMGIEALLLVAEALLEPLPRLSVDGSLL